MTRKTLLVLKNTDPHMKFLHPITIDVFRFFTEGLFDYVQLGADKAWIGQNFADPDSKNDMGHDLAIWLYGTIEFHFDGDTLFQIYCDGFEGVNACPALDVRKWILAKKPKTLSLEKVIHTLNHHKINLGAEVDVVILPANEAIYLPINLLQTVFYNGELTKEYSLQEIRHTLHAGQF